MYQRIKNVLKGFFSHKFLIKHELFLRRLYALKYLGKSCQCTICYKTFSHFIQPDDKEKICPYCGSLSRNRRLKILIDEINVGGKLLDFSPSRALFRVLSKMKRIDYISSDYANEFIAYRKYDITNIPEPQNIFDHVICYHILEHIIDDKKAISELYRVLKKNGLAFIQTPFKEGDIYEDYSIKDEKKRETNFGQKDHVRVYSVAGLAERLEEAGFSVSVKTFNNISEDYQMRYGLDKNEIVLIAKKN